MRHAIEKIKLAKTLRKTGHTLSEIVGRIQLPKTTVWHHIKSVPISQEYIKVFAKKQAGSIVRSTRDWDRARSEASGFMPEKFDLNTAGVLAALLYWGEGSKRDFNLTNSDPDLIKLFMLCMGRLGLTPTQFALHVRVYEDIKTEAAIKYWVNLTKIPRSNVVRVELLKGKKEGKLPYGMCRIRLYKGGYQLKLLTAIKEHLIKLV